MRLAYYKAFYHPSSHIYVKEAKERDIWWTRARRVGHRDQFQSKRTKNLCITIASHQSVADVPLLSCGVVRPKTYKFNITSIF